MIELLTDQEISTLNDARIILAVLEKRAQRAYTSDDLQFKAYQLGRVAEAAYAGADAVFSVLNTLNTYGEQEMTTEQLHPTHVLRAALAAVEVRP
jgi:hypothetical protein